MSLFNMKMEDALLELEDNSVDSIITDPPYGIDFMGKKWDYNVPSKEMWEECIRVLKPGGHLLSFSSARTYHRMAVAIEDAGFEIRDQVMWCYNSGFPKSYNLGKAYDKKHGREREDLGPNPNNRPNPNNKDTATHDYGFVSKSANITRGDGPLEGWGTALKPAHEPIAVCRKPLSEKTVLANAEKWGTGGLNIEASRVGDEVGDQGRWPANLISDGEVFGDNTKFYFVPKVSKRERNEGLDDFDKVHYSNDGRQKTNDTAYQRGNATSSNPHPTVKPIALMEYLIKMVAPAGGIVLDPFMGSGSTGCAAVKNGYGFIGVEMEEHSYEIAKARIEYWGKECVKQ